MIQRIKFKPVFFRFLEIIVAIWPALYSGFPLVTPDSGTYISSGLQLSVPMDRPITYGLFVLLSSTGISLWLTIFAQGIIFTWLIRRLCKKILGNKIHPTIITAIIIIISFGTSAAWFNSQLMADAFSGIMVIAVILLFLERENKKVIRWLLPLIGFMLLVHTSHILIMLLFSVFAGAYFLKQKRKYCLSICKKLLITVLSCILVLGTVNLIEFHIFSLSPASDLFLLGRMAEDGVLDQYLAEKCPVEHYSLCDFQGKLGDRQWEFMWMGDFPHNKPNGWINTRKEYIQIITGILTTPKYSALFLLKSIEGTFRQLTQIYVGDGLTPQQKESSVYRAVDKYFGHEIKPFRSSLQANDDLPMADFNKLSFLFCMVIFLMVLFISVQPRKYSTSASSPPNTEWSLIFGIALSLIILNAFVTSTFSTVLGRLQSRVFWVLPAIALLYVIQYYVNVKSNKKEQPTLPASIT